MTKPTLQEMMDSLQGFQGAANINGLVRLQQEYEQQGYWVKMKTIEDLRHVQNHLTKLLGKIAQITEPYEHIEQYLSGNADPTFDREDEMRKLQDSYDKLMETMPADLLIYSLHFTVRNNQNLGQSLYDRYRMNMESR
jgi:hypothetical protein